MEWRDVIGYEGAYQVSRCGQLKSMDRHVPHYRGGLKKLCAKPMRQVKRQNGYMGVTLYSEGKQKNALVHRLVAMAFIENPSRHPQVNHKSADKADNRAENLEWVTMLENIAHATALKLNRRGSLINTSKLRVDQVLEIRKLYATKQTSIPKLGRKFSVTNNAIFSIIHRRSWAHV